MKYVFEEALDKCAQMLLDNSDWADEQLNEEVCPYTKWEMLDMVTRDCATAMVEELKYYLTQRAYKQAEDYLRMYASRDEEGLYDLSDLEVREC